MITDYIMDLMGDLKPTGKGDQLHGNCPFCGDRRSRLYIGVYNQKVYCHNCGYGGTIIKLIADIERIPYTKAFEIYKEYNGSIVIPEDVTEELSNMLNKIDYTKYLTKSAIPLPEEFQLLEGNTSVYAGRVRKYLTSRLVTKKQIKSHKMGYCSSGKYEGRAILPIYQEDELKFWVARATSKDAYKKELSPSDEDYQVSKSEVIFNIDRAAKLFNTAIISEGIFDAVSWGDVGAGLLGKRCSEEQLKILLSYKDKLTDGVYLALDPDAWKYMIEIADELHQYMPVKIIKMPGDYDPNDYARKYGKSACLKLIDSAVEYDRLFKLRSKFM